MLEARLAAASVLKRLLDGLSSLDASFSPINVVYESCPAIKELVTDANFECNEEGLVRSSTL